MPGATGAPAGAGRTAVPQTGTKQGTTAKPATTTTTKTNTAKSDKAVAEAAKYQLSVHRTDLIRSIVDGYASNEDLSDSTIVRSILNDIAKQMPLIPAVPLEKVDLQALNDEAKKKVEQEYGVDDKKYVSIVEAEASVLCSLSSITWA